MRIATYNVEWFNNLFDDAGNPVADDDWSARRDVTRAQQLEALGIVFTAIDADAVMVVEAPDTNGKRSTTRALENFAAAFSLRTNRALMGFTSDTQQQIALLYDPLKLEVRHDPWGEETGKKGRHGAPRFDGAFRWDLDVDATSEIVRFSKPPLEIAARTMNGRAFRMIGVHVKSKAPHGARDPADVMRLSIENRRKQLAQCIWLRARIEQHLDNGDSLIVLGDLNDGPGLDAYEKLFGRSGLEIVMGQNDGPLLCDPHASLALGGKFGVAPASARFYMADRGCFMQALLDYILVSDDLAKLGPKWRIWHPFDDPVCYGMPELREALLTASDHFPVTLDVEIDQPVIHP